MAEFKTWNGQIFDELRPEGRPRDVRGDGRGLRFRAFEHDEMTMPQAIEVREGVTQRMAVYVPERVPEPEARPQDGLMDGRALRYTPLAHDDMGVPLSIEVADAEGRRAVYVQMEIDGTIVVPR